MAPRKSKLNDAKSKVIESEILKQNPEGLPNGVPDSHGMVFTKYIPVMKKIIFLNGRDPGCALQFHYRTKTHPLHQYTLYHGHEHDLPEEVIEHLESCSEPQYAYRTGLSGHPEMYIKTVKYIFQCKNPKRVA